MDILYERVKSLLKVKHYYDNLRTLDTSGQIFSINKVNKSLDHFDVGFFNNVACTEEIVKSHLEMILLKFLSEKPMCGLEIIKGNMRTKKYSATGKGKITIYKKINEFVNMEMNILNSIQVQTSSASL